VYHPHVAFHNLDMPALATLNSKNPKGVESVRRSTPCIMLHSQNLSIRGESLPGISKSTIPDHRHFLIQFGVHPWSRRQIRLH